METLMPNKAFHPTGLPPLRCGSPVGERKR
jgi:hypothetical protein